MRSFAIALFAIAAAPAAAQTYGTLSLGPAKVEDLNFRDPQTANVLLDVGSAWQASGALGYRWSDHLRTEITLGYLDANAKGTQSLNIVTIAACGITPATPCLTSAVRGDVKGVTALAMGYVDLSTDGPVVPFLGAGVGMARQSLEINATQTSGPSTGGPFAIVDDGDNAFAYRATAGLTFNLAGVDADLAYSYTRTAKPSLKGRSTFINFTFDRPLEVHAVTAAVRIGF